MTAAAAEHLPFEDRPFRWRMGLVPLDLSDWLEVDEQRDADLAAKRALLAERPDDVVRWLPGSEAAAGEVLAAVEAATGSRGAAGLHPVDAAGRLVQEDLCVVQDGVLVAASVCSPLRWRVADKVGRSVREIHGPVARYDEQLADPVDAFLARLTVERPVWRRNWNLVDDPTAFQPEPDPKPVLDVGRDVWLRVERQTLRRFPETGCVLFTIRTHQRPVGSLAGRPDVTARLAGAVRALPPDVAAYKGIVHFADALLAYLSGAAAG